MAKLSPPVLATTIPAFYAETESTETEGTVTTVKITVPYTMNRSVSPDAVKGFAIKVKTAQNSTELDLAPDLQSDWNPVGSRPVVFKLTNANGLRVGAFYKIQLAYKSDPEEEEKEELEIGYFSSVAMCKYTSKPTLSIQNLDKAQVNSHSYTYEGLYKSADLTERVYSYRFDLYNELGALVDTSGTLLHNADEDAQDGSSIDRYTFSQDLPVGKNYKITYTIITNNGLEESVNYFITQQSSINPNLNANIVTKLNYDNGYIQVGLKVIDDDQLTSGSFILARSSSDSDYTDWEEISKFQLCAQIPTLTLYKDFTIEQGKTYKYSMQQYNQHGIRSSRVLSEPIYADFEDAFLFDGTRQLKLRYNPKISSFKKDLLETKVDTIGGKYPFIFRNGRVYYSEFPLSGLISYQMDEENLFMSEEEFSLIEKTTNLTSENIAGERVFKMKVLEWLTNGEPKVFRSPTEGNFIVRLMNTSMSPNDTVGRMLHTFSSTAYEVADFNYNNLIDLGFITLEVKAIDLIDWHTIDLKGYPENRELLPEGVKAISVRFDDMPNTVIAITFEDNTIEQFIITSGELYVATSVKIISCSSSIYLSQGLMTYSHPLEIITDFDQITDVEITTKTTTFFGQCDILEKIKVDNRNQELVNISKIVINQGSQAVINGFLVVATNNDMEFTTLPEITELTLPYSTSEATVTYNLIGIAPNKGDDGNE